MKLLDRFKVLIKENSQFIAGIIFTGGVALIIYFLRHQIIFLGRSFWNLAEVFALPITLLFIYWLYQNKRKDQNSNGATIASTESQGIIDWRRDLKKVASKDKLKLDDVYLLRASVALAPQIDENLSSYQFMSNAVISFCNELVTKHQDNETEVVWLKDEHEREQVRLYSRYLLKAEFEMAQGNGDKIALEEKLKQIQVITVSLLEEQREPIKKV